MKKMKVLNKNPYAIIDAFKNKWIRINCLDTNAGNEIIAQAQKLFEAWEKNET